MVNSFTGAGSFSSGMSLNAGYLEENYGVDAWGLWTRVDEWTGGSIGPYKGNVCFEKGDTLLQLAKSITGHGADSKELKINNKLKIKQIVNIAPLLKKLEERNRKSVVAAAARFKGRFPRGQEKFENGSSVDPKNLDDWFKEGKKGCVDCLGAAFIVIAKGLSDSIGNANFVALYKVNAFPRERYSVKIGESKNGDWGYFLNDKNYPDKHTRGGYRGENVIKVGNDQWWGFPGGIKSQAGWAQILIKEYNRGLPRTEHINKIPGWSGNAIFINNSKVGMDLFDKNN